jgi:hypothetical protein
MPLDEPVKFSQFKKELFKLFKTCEATPEINTDAVLYHPYTIFFTYKLKHSTWKMKIDPGSPIASIFNSEYTQDFIVDSTITFEFYYMTNAVELHDDYVVRIKISHLYVNNIKVRTFIYNNLREFMKAFNEIFSLFKPCIESESTENIDLVIKNYENYCEISQL